MSLMMIWLSAVRLKVSFIYTIRCTRCLICIYTNEMNMYYSWMLNQSYCIDHFSWHCRIWLPSECEPRWGWVPDADGNCKISVWGDELNTIVLNIKTNILGASFGSPVFYSKQATVSWSNAITNADYKGWDLLHFDSLFGLSMMYDFYVSQLLPLSPCSNFKCQCVGHASSS